VVAAKYHRVNDLQGLARPVSVLVHALFRLRAQLLRYRIDSDNGFQMALHTY
jgi:hypothetical protein